MDHETRLAEMIATRLCHDLTGPIGAVNNGAEFLDDEGFDMQHEAMKLILGSAQEAVNRLLFYRQAYGRVGDAGEASLSEKKKIAQDFFSNSKITLDWPDIYTDSCGIAISQKMSRLLLNLLIIVAGSAIRGGTLSVRVSMSPANEKQIQVSVVGETIKVDLDTLAILEGKTDGVALSPKTAQPYLALRLSQELRASLNVDAQPTQMTIRMSQPEVALANAS